MKQSPHRTTLPNPALLQTKTKRNQSHPPRTSQTPCRQLMIRIKPRMLPILPLHPTTLQTQWKTKIKLRMKQSLHRITPRNQVHLQTKMKRSQSHPQKISRTLCRQLMIRIKPPMLLTQLHRPTTVLTQWRTKIKQITALIRSHPQTIQLTLITPRPMVLTRLNLLRRTPPIRARPSTIRIRRSTIPRQ